jgi:prepilin-type N-terminal cleavage/methylation domain-containing protein
MQKKRAFTIIELLVVVSIIALLVGILLPAIGKARDQAQLTKSQANVKNLGTAAVTYSAEWSDRQLTYVNDNFSRYGANGGAAVNGYEAVVGYDHPPVILGYGQGGIWGFFLGPQFGTNGNYITIIPADLDQTATKFGAFRIVNGRQFNQYINGRFYDPVFFAPKDTAVMASVERWFDHPDEYVPSATTGGQKWSSYCFSPAAMFSPDVLSLNKQTNRYYTSPFSMQSGFRSPSMGQAQYPDLKTHIMEHHWLQNRKKICNPFFATGPYDGCQPFFFNGSWDSAPVTCYYDGHIENRGQRDAIDSNSRIAQQNNGPAGADGLWSIHTQWQGGYADYSTGGYYLDACLDWSSTSYHILTIEGIKGRDFVAN